MLSNIRLEQYRKNNYLFHALKFFRGYSPKSKENSTLANLVGYELNIYLAEQLIKKGYKVKQEVPIENTQIDILANQNNEYHAYECKAVSTLRSKKVVKQITSYKGHYKNVHVLVCKDTVVKDLVAKRIQSVGVDIIHADITKAELFDRIHSIKNKYEVKKFKKVMYILHSLAHTH